MESTEDFKSFCNFGLSSPIIEERFEWFDTVDEEYSDGCIVLDNERAINIIGKTDFFKEAFKQ